MPRILITILALALLLVGCGERISPEKYAELKAQADTIVARHDTLVATIAGILSYIPCPPCPPETVFAMPEGEWMKTEDFYRKCLLHRKAGVSLEPDSVFIPRKE